MGGKTHLVGALAASMAASQLLGYAPLPEAALAAGAAVAGGKAPDLDRHLNDGPDHRSITHSLLVAGGAVVALMVVLFSQPYLGPLAVGFGAGYLSHLALDGLTPARVFVLGPGGPRAGIGLFQTGGVGELGVGAALVVAVVVMAGGYLGL